MDNPSVDNCNSCLLLNVFLRLILKESEFLDLEASSKHFTRPLNQKLLKFVGNKNICSKNRAYLFFQHFPHQLS